MRKWMALGCMTIVLFGAAAQAEDEVSVSVTSDFFSKYVWRGQNVTDDWVWQPGASISYKGLTGGFWGNLDLTDENDESGQFIEYEVYRLPGLQLLHHAADLPGLRLVGLGRPARRRWLARETRLPRFRRFHRRSLGRGVARPGRRDRLRASDRKVRPRRQTERDHGA